MPVKKILLRMMVISMSSQINLNGNTRQDKFNLIRSLYVKSQSITSTSNTTYWWVQQMQTEWVTFEAVRKRYFGLREQNFEDPVFLFGWFSLKAARKLKLQKLLPCLCLCTLFLTLTYSFFFRHLPTETFIFITVCYQIKRFSSDSFYFF